MVADMLRYSLEATKYVSQTPNPEISARVESELYKSYLTDYTSFTSPSLPASTGNIGDYISGVGLMVVGQRSSGYEIRLTDKAVSEKISVSVSYRGSQRSLALQTDKFSQGYVYTKEGHISTMKEGIDIVVKSSSGTVLASASYSIMDHISALDSKGKNSAFAKALYCFANSSYEYRMHALAE
jgi:hypothetical protein